MAWKARLHAGTIAVALVATVAVAAGFFDPAQAPAPPSGLRIVGGTETTPPVFSLVAASATRSAATIAWTTDEPSDTQVIYGVTTAFGSASPLNTSAVTSHTVILSGLAPGARYYFRALSRDVAGNLGQSAVATFTTSGGIAENYPGDVGIEADPNVIFVERFDEGVLGSLFGRWTDILNGTLMSFSADVPPGSPVGASLNIPWVGGGVSNGGHLYKQLAPGVDDTLYVRYYIKYPTTGRYSHNGIWVGGYNPPIPWPNPQAGLKPAGNDRFSAAAEQDSLTTRFDHYNYWMDMRLSTDGNYWGNLLLNDPNVRGASGQWMCVEQMVKLNNPVSASNGEHAIWVDGAKISHLGQGFPNGSWSGGIFTQSATGTPFGGLRWRSDPNLKINYIWLQNYAPNDPAGFSGAMKFAHVVAAKSYIGCLTPAAGGDTTPPAVSISAPSGGSAVSGAVALTAAASDNVGVSGVQFKLDGNVLGAEDVSAPYSVSWDTATATAGVHTLTAVARDAAGNQTTSAAVSITVNNALPGSGVIFESNWDNAGTSAAAVTDGGKWTQYWEFNNGTGVQLLSIVPGGPAGYNALRVQQRGPNFAGDVQVENFMPPSTDYYVRYYMKNDDTSPAGDHVVTVDIWQYGNLTYMRKYSTVADWSFVISMYGCGYTYPIGHWGPAPKLAHGQWYRFEYFVHFVDPTHIQVHPRVYDASGALIFSDADIRQSDYKAGGVWNGRDDWTLASYYAGGNSFCVNPAWMTNFGMGNNGNLGAADTGQYWYYSALQIRRDTWPGPATPR